MATIAMRDRNPDNAVRSTRSALESVVLALLGANAAIWITFQVVEIKAPFPPIGILYALGSLIIAGVLLRSRKPWVPALASAWAVLTMIPESIPAVGHLLDWSELYTHFGHYLIIMTFFPLALLMAATGIAATVRNRATAGADVDAPVPSWLRTAVTGVIAFVVVANLVTIILYVLEIP